jgi:Aromatic acid exporter family member 2
LFFAYFSRLLTWIRELRYFCVGVTTAYGIVHRLDRLMVATKELVGEQYHIHGIGLRQFGGGEDIDGLRSGKSQSSDVRPAKDA